MGTFEDFWGNVIAFFARCWRGECEISTAFLSAVLLGAIITQPLFLLWEHATAENWPSSVRWTIFSVWMLGALFVLTWYTVSMWRAARHSFLLGKRFWPIVGSLAAVGLPTYLAATFVTASIGGMFRIDGLPAAIIGDFEVEWIVIGVVVVIVLYLDFKRSRYRAPQGRTRTRTPRHNRATRTTETGS